MTDNTKESLISDLNSVLKEHFDYVPLYKVIDIAKKLVDKGWIIKDS